MVIKFAFKKSHSKIFGDIWRPVARVVLTSPSDSKLHQEAWMVVDSGADYTKMERVIPVGFLDRNEVPPLMGRQLFMESLETYFSSKHIIYFSDKLFKSTR